MSTTFCKDCRHHNGGGWCFRDAHMQREFSIVYGKEITVWEGRQFCDERRSSNGDCGPGAVLFEPRLRLRIWRWLRNKAPSGSGG